jgi:nucleotide-binding universal stress UspA family protein
MYRHILVALDKADLSHGVLAEAIALAQPLQAKLTLLHALSNRDVASPTMPLIPVPEYYPSLSATTLELYQEEWTAFEAHSLTILKRHQATAQAAGLAVQVIQRSGNPGVVICEVAQAIQADLILIGRRGYSGLSELLLGSVSNYVVHHAPCAVLVCHIALESAAPKPDPEATQGNVTTA